MISSFLRFRVRFCDLVNLRGEMVSTMATENPTELLVNKAQRGDRHAFGQLVELYSERLSNQIKARMGSKLRSRMEVEDILQETFAVAYETIGGFSWRDEESFYRWLGSIAEHLLWSSSQKKAWDQMRLRPHEVTDKAVSPSKGLRQNDRFDRLEKALDSLSEDHRQVLRLVRIEGLKVKDVAARMIRSPDAVWKLLARALVQLRRSFGDTESLHLPHRRFRSEGERDDG